jgi:hypothetical protein
MTLMAQLSIKERNLSTVKRTNIFMKQPTSVGILKLHVKTEKLPTQPVVSIGIVAISVVHYFVMTTKLIEMLNLFQATRTYSFQSEILKHALIRAHKPSCHVTSTRSVPASSSLAYQTAPSSFVQHTSGATKLQICDSIN